MMGKYMLFIIFLFSISISFCLAEVGCPEASKISPCICIYPETPSLKCENLKEAETLKRVFKNSARYSYSAVTISKSILNYIPHEMFEDVGVRALSVDNVTLNAVFDEPPKALESLTVLRIERSQVLRGVVWEFLSPLTKLEWLDVTDVPVRSLKAEFSQYASSTIQRIIFQRTETQSIKPGAFQNLANLEKLYIDNGKLTELRRDYFPTPFTSITTLGFSGNRIKTIPEGMFAGMPNLFAVVLMNNQISTVDARAFDENPLRVFALEGNPIECDCRIFWLVEKKINSLDGFCDSPEQLKGRQLKTLTNDDLHCK